MADVVIVGGGVVGCAAAYHLSKAGAGVALVEQGEVGRAASGAAAGILVPPAEAVPPGAFGDFCRAGADCYPRLVQALRGETGIDVQYLASGILLLARTKQRAQALHAVAVGQQGQEASLQWLEGDALRRLEPALAEDVLGAVYSSEGRHVNPGLLTQALVRAAVARGAALRQGRAVAGFLRHGSRVTTVRTSGGDTIAADHVVLAAGPWTRRLGRRLGAEVPTRPMRGQMLAYRSNALRHIIWGEDGYLVPKPGGFLYAGATVEGVGFRPQVTRRGLAWLRRMATAMVPALRYAEVASAWAGLRPGSPDGLPIIGPLPKWRNVLVATGHFRDGILMAPITGELIAQLITQGKTPLPLEPFSPSRFC